MKKMMKISKIFLLIVTVFSYVASPIAVLADEITSLPFSMKLAVVDSDEDGYVDYYDLTYKCQNDVCDVLKDYTIELEATYTYNDDTTETDVEEPILVNGNTLNTEESSYRLYPSNSNSKYYDYEYKLDITVYDGEDAVYEDLFSYSYSSLKGLTGKLNDVVPTTEKVSDTTTSGKYDVTDGKYTQYLSILTGELSPNGNYRVVYGEENYSDVMTSEDLRNLVLTGTETDLTGKLFGKYTYTDSVTFEEVEVNLETQEVTVVNTYTYNYNASLVYGTNNDELFSNMYGITFEDGYVTVNAKELYETESVITLEKLLEVLSETSITLEVKDNEKNILDLTASDVLASEIKNGYTLNFVNGATASYVVIVKGDSTLDNIFNSDDLVGVMEGYLNEDNMPSMDMITLEEEVEDSDENVKEEFGTITFEDVMFGNELLKENGDTNKVVEENTGLTLEFGEVISENTELYVGDTFELDVLVNSDDVLDYIDGIDALVSTSDNLKLNNVTFEEITGTYNDEGRVVGAGVELVNGKVVMTLEFYVVGDGTASVELSGSTYKFLSGSEFETITKEVEITRRSSVNNLSSLNASVGKFDKKFDKDVTVYTLTVPYNTESVILSGGLEDINSSVDGLIRYELTENKTTAIITVTAEDGSTKVYTVYIIKGSKPTATKKVTYSYSSNNYLKSLEIDGYEIEFNKKTDLYNITVKNGVTSLDIKALAEDSDARVEITGNGDFKEGENTVTITVTAENGNVRKYKLVVTMEEEKHVDVTSDDSSSTGEKIVIIILIILVVLGLLYLIFKKDDEDEEVKTPVKKEEVKNNKTTNENKNTSNNKNKNKKRKK